MDEQKVLILAAGKAARWEGKPKQLMSIGEETILQRQQRQIRARGGYPVIVTRNGAIASAVNDYVLIPSLCSTTCETLLSTESLWGRRNIVLLGDVVFTGITMDTIMKYYDGLQVYGNEWEIYAIGFSGDVVDKVKRHLQLGHEHGGKMRYFYQSYCGLLLGSSSWENKVLRWVQNLTRDIDSQWEYDQFVKRVVNTGRLDDLP